MNDQQAQQIAGDYLEDEIISVHPIVGKGSVNRIFAANSSKSKVIVRMNNEIDSLKVYEKERWCMEQAIWKGIPSPSVLKIGETGKVTYMIQNFVDGVNGEDDFNYKSKMWKKLGEYAKVIHSINVNGYGEYLSNPIQGNFMTPPHDDFDGTWSSFVDYNINSLKDNDELIRLGVINREQSKMVKKLFFTLREKEFKVGLNHGDLSLKNTILEPSGKVTLLDWGSAEVNIVPHWDIIQILKCHLELKNPNESHIRDFLDGYGISPKGFKDLKHDLNTMLILRAFDKLRWAIARNPIVIPEFANYAKMLLARYLFR
jgi:aminoglycoside phosphotransferase (APT) family kinase protein